MFGFSWDILQDAQEKNSGYKIGEIIWYIHWLSLIPKEKKKISEHLKSKQHVSE